MVVDMNPKIVSQETLNLISTLCEVKRQLLNAHVSRDAIVTAIEGAISNLAGNDYVYVMDVVLPERKRDGSIDYLG